MTLPPFHLERYFARYEFTARHLLSSSDCETWTVAELLALEPGGQGRLERLRLGYTESAGDPELRQAIAGIYQSVGPGDVLVHAGAEEAIFTFMHVALEPGHHLIVHAPAYQSLYAVAEARGVEVSRWQGSEDDGWSLDPDALAALVQKETKAVVVNCPHNPTGYLMDRERFDAVVEISRRHGLLLFSDEVYRELEHDPAARLPAACDVYERAVSLGVMSKTYGLAGLRIGWLATHELPPQPGRLDMGEVIAHLQEALPDFAQGLSRVLPFTYGVRAIREALAPGGSVLIADEKVAPSFTSPGDEMERLMYGWSIVHCLPVSMAESPSAAIGTVIRSGVILRRPRRSTASS